MNPGSHTCQVDTGSNAYWDHEDTKTHFAFVVAFVFRIRSQLGVRLKPDTTYIRTLRSLRALRST